MATIRYEGDERVVPDGSALLEACEEMNYPFGCQDGLCGTCLCTVITGMENLAPKNEKELDYALEGEERLVCQCVINGGLVEIEMD